jgi:hypothetical protein
VGVSADVNFNNNLDIGFVGSVGPVNVATPTPFQVATPTPFQAAVSTPTPLHAAVDSVGPVGPVTIALPNPIDIDFDITNIPKINIGIDPLTINPLTINPVTADLNVSLKEIPNVRAHLPADFNLGLSVLGLELVCVRLCGEAQIITEPYVPNPCERCGPERKPTPPPNPPTQDPVTGLMSAVRNP